MQEPTIKRNLNEELSAAEKDLLDKGDAVSSAPPAPEDKQESASDPNKLPGWAAGALPDGCTPPEGIVVHFLRIRADKAKPGVKEDHVLVLWELGLGDERTARTRTFGDANRTYEEMAKMMIRARSGVAVDPGKPDGVERIWDQLGPRYRGLLVLWYLRTHQLGDGERLRFFAEDVAFRTMS